MDRIWKSTSQPAGFRSQSQGPQASAYLEEETVPALRGSGQTETMGQAGLREQHPMFSPTRNDVEERALLSNHLLDEHVKGRCRTEAMMFAL